jgi:hypothetical protein
VPPFSVSNKFSFEDITVLILGDCSYVYWLDYPEEKRLKMLKGTRGRPI